MSQGMPTVRRMSGAMTNLGIDSCTGRNPVCEQSCIRRTLHEARAIIEGRNPGSDYLELSVGFEPMTCRLGIRLTPRAPPLTLNKAQQNQGKTGISLHDTSACFIPLRHQKGPFFRNELLDLRRSEHARRGSRFLRLGLSRHPPPSDQSLKLDHESPSVAILYVKISMLETGSGRTSHQS
jgi:hypothetical protein